MPRAPLVNVQKLLTLSATWQNPKATYEKLVSLLNINDYNAKKEIMETVPFTIAPQNIEVFKINLTKETKYFFNGKFTKSR